MELKDIFANYAIDMNGTIYTTKRKGTSGGVVKHWENGRGYQSVRLMINGKPKVFTVHSLLATAFLRNPDKLPSINHKDGNKQNNKLNNLEWCTNSQNVAHAWRTGLREVKSSSGERFIYLCKLTNRWRVIIGLEGKKYRLGRFDTIKEAKETRNEFLRSNYDAQSQETKDFIGSLLGV